VQADAAASQMLTFRLHTRQSQRANALRNDVPPGRRAVN
jgi:hypothetical protein